MKVFKLYLLTILTAFSFGQIDDGCDLPDLNLYVTPDGAVLYNSTEAIGGFQFTLDGATASATGGGDAAVAGFVVQGSTTILGFSFTGSSVPAGCGTLTELTVDGPPSGLSGIVISDPSGSALEFTYYVEIEDVAGCTDDTACNFNPDATLDDESCEYAEENFDCDGNCIVDTDCAGECGGSAIEDQCGVCNGDGDCGSLPEDG